MPIAFFSTEFDHREWTKRLAVQKCELDQDIDNLDDDQKSAYKLAYESIEKKPIYYRHDKNITLEDLVSKTREIKKAVRCSSGRLSTGY